MKNKLFLNVVTSIGIAVSFTLLSFQIGEKTDGQMSAIKPAAVQASYQYDSVKVTSSYKFDHAASAASQSYARIVYPVFQDNKINNILKSVVLSPLKVKYRFQNALAAEHPALSNMDAINNGATEYQKMAANFLQQFEIAAPEEDLKAYWYADIHVKVLTEKQGYTAILCEKDYFTGGLHDVYDHIYLNYDNRNHQLITLISQLKPNKQDQLKVIAERIFRANEALTPAEDLDGYFFENEKFDLPDNFTITNNGLVFFYDYDEIKPFAAATTQLVIPFTQLKDIVLPGSILANQMDKR
jgi:hypothetical protein